MFLDTTKFYHVRNGVIEQLHLKPWEVEISCDTYQGDLLKSGKTTMTIKFKTTYGFIILEFMNGQAPYTMLHVNGAEHIIFMQDITAIFGIKESMESTPQQKAKKK